MLSAFSMFATYPSEKEKKHGLLNTSQGGGSYNVDDDKIIFIYLFALWEAVAMKSRPGRMLRANEVYRGSA